MFLSHDVGVEHFRGGLEGVDGWVNSQFRKRPREHSGGVQVSKGSGWSRIGQIVGRNINGLNACN